MRYGSEPANLCRDATMTGRVSRVAIAPSSKLQTAMACQRPETADNDGIAVLKGDICCHNAAVFVVSVLNPFSFKICEKTARNVRSGLVLLIVTRYGTILET